jgi:Bacterial PH domain
MNRFLSSKNTFTVSILWILVLFMIALLWISFEIGNTRIVPIIILSLVIGLLIWTLLDTRYVIKRGFLFYRSGPFRGRIDIKKIQIIKHFSGLYAPVNMKPALDTNGFIITYNNSFDDVYVSPKESESFIKELLKVNPNIIIKR